MSKTSQELTATQPASGIGSVFIENKNSPWIPQPPQVSTPFVCEHVDVQPIAQSFAPNVSKLTYEIPW